MGWGEKGDEGRGMEWGEKGSEMRGDGQDREGGGSMERLRMVPVEAHADKR